MKANSSRVTSQTQSGVTSVNLPVLTERRAPTMPGRRLKSWHPLCAKPWLRPRTRWCGRSLRVRPNAWAGNAANVRNVPTAPQSDRRGRGCWAARRPDCNQRDMIVTVRHRTVSDLSWPINLWLISEERWLNRFYRVYVIIKLS